jgi:hypothetical protein
VGPLAPGATVNLTVEREVALAAGPHELRVVVDPPGAPGTSPVSGAVFERSESNNTARLAFTMDERPPEPAGPPPQNVATPAAEASAFVVIALMAAGTGAYAVVRVRMRRRRGEP